MRAWRKCARRICMAAGCLVLVALVSPSAVASEAKASAYSWRGYMLDVSRHFFTVDEVKKVLDAMAVVGLNVFHWHLTDNPGWRIQIDTFPELTKSGATTIVSSMRVSTMGMYETDGEYGPFFYTKDAIRDVVSYADKLGIVVVPEIDVPGHSGAAIRAYQYLACKGKGGTELCPGKDETLRFYERVLDEVLELFPSKAIHLGGDECNHRQWESCADCQRRIREHGLRGEKGLQGWFMAHFARYLEDKGRRMVAWDDVVEFGDLPKSTIAMVYRRKKMFGPVAAARGYDVVMTSGYYWDYVQGLENDPYEYQPFGYVCTWKKIMSRDPAEGFAPESRGRLLGAQGCMWTELVGDIAGVEWRTWPRMAALAQVLADGNPGDEKSFAVKLETSCEKLKQLGVNVAPLGPVFREELNLEPGVRCLWQREDFAKLLPLAVTESPFCFDWTDSKSASRKIFARKDEKYPTGAYLLDMDWMRLEVIASDDAGLSNACRQVRRLARLKRGGVTEYPSCRLAYGAIPKSPIDAKTAFVDKVFATGQGVSLHYRWREPRHMQLGGNYPLLLIRGGTDAEISSCLQGLEERNEEMFVCVIAKDSPSKTVSCLLDDLTWRIRCLDGKRIKRIEFSM